MDHRSLNTDTIMNVSKYSKYSSLPHCLVQFKETISVLPKGLKVYEMELILL